MKYVTGSGWWCTRSCMPGVAYAWLRDVDSLVFQHGSQAEIQVCLERTGFDLSLASGDQRKQT